jgi:BirA family biotin operon repressor/biotin-[acetyl-CoA-carboxylase] ligase
MAVIIGKNIITLGETDSTNNYATRLVKAGSCPEGQVIVADLQLQGRGQINNTWESENGKNLLLSIVLYPNFLPIQFQFQISKVVTLGIFETLIKYTDGVSVKWPNDIYIGPKKVAGVLIENSIMGSRIDTTIVGIGLNVNQLEFKSNALNPISLAQIVQYDIDKSVILKELIENIDRWYLLLCDGQLGIIDKTYLSVLYRLGKKANYTDKDGDFEGTIIDINPIGQLVVRKEDNVTREYHFKEIEFSHY